MADRLIFEVAVDIALGGSAALKAAHGEVLMIPFGGEVHGSIFNGTVLPGGTDVQTVDANGVRKMDARYMLEGTDYTGAPCRIYVENVGYFPAGAHAMPFKTVSTFLTDSEALAPLLHSASFRGEGHPREGGVLIKIFLME